MLSGRERQAQIELLTRINAAEFLNAIGLGWMRGGMRRALLQLSTPAARQISTDMVRFDELLADRGLRDGAIAILDELVKRVDVGGAEHLPKSGPLLIAANHPGLTDVLPIFATVDRDDLHVVAADYPLLKALTGVNRHFIVVRENAGPRRQALHEVTAHLKNGEAVLILAAGKIEPDPAVSTRAIEVLDEWSISLGVIARRVPHLRIVPAIVSGVLTPQYQRHPLTRIRRRAIDRQQLGATLQVLARASSQTVVRLAYGEAVIGDAAAGARGITSAVVMEALALMREAMNDYARAPGQGVKALSGLSTARSAG